MSPRIREEIRQTRPFASPADEALLNLLRTAHLLEQRHARFFKPWRLTPAQYNALRILRGSHPETLPCSEVGDRMVTPVPDVTRLLDRLEDKGLSYRHRDEQDRRVVQVGITGEGLALLARLDEPLARFTEELFGHMEAGALDRLSRLLESVRDHPSAAPSNASNPSKGES